MDIYFVRHGQSDGDITKVHEGRADLPLTNKGVNQAKTMSNFFIDKPIDCIWASPLQRAHATAEILKESFLNHNKPASDSEELDTEDELPLILLDDLKEWNNGVLAGMKRSEARKIFPKPKVRKWHESVLEGESELSFRYRATNTVEYILDESRKNKYKTIVIVSHGAIISRMLQALLGLPFKTNVLFQSGDTGIHHISIKKENTIVRFMNHTE
ncbi:histidine phosphatase family protein [Bacillus cereus]|nr:histidine phosphatase family protein [Bacillus cereus]HDR8330098.1 histidine phosphatase family protein [Bacillus cereus]HDR8337070.1 histidine phosphatase family protein [Bacillus cereus]